MTVEDSVKGYTINAAAAAWRSQDTGSLEVGKSADLIVLDRDIFTCSPYDIGDTVVETTMFRGHTVHEFGN